MALVGLALPGCGKAACISCERPRDARGLTASVPRFDAVEKRPPRPRARGSTVRGRIFDEGGHYGRVWVNVVLVRPGEDPRSAWRTSGAQGFLFDPVPPGSYELLVIGEGFIGERPPLARFGLQVGEDPAEYRLRLMVPNLGLDIGCYCEDVFDDLPVIAVEDLMRDLRRWQGRRVAVSGYMSLGFEDSSLRPSADWRGEWIQLEWSHRLEGTPLERLNHTNVIVLGELGMSPSLGLGEIGVSVVKSRCF